MAADDSEDAGGTWLEVHRPDTGGAGYSVWSPSVDCCASGSSKGYERLGRTQRWRGTCSPRAHRSPSVVYGTYRQPHGLTQRGYDRSRRVGFSPRWVPNRCIAILSGDRVAQSAERRLQRRRSQVRVLPLSNKPGRFGAHRCIAGKPVAQAVEHRGSPAKAAAAVAGMEPEVTGSSPVGNSWSASRGLLRQVFLDSDPLWRDPLPRGVKQGPDLRRLASYPCTDPRHGRAKPRGEISRHEDRASQEAKRGQSSTATEFRGISAPRRLSGSQFRQGALSSVARAQRSKKVQRSAVRVRQGPPDSSIAQHLSAKSVRLQDQTPGWQVL